jgi:phosphatidylethanolamine-binding protein (PEBP) family uncharacterized protein
MALIAFVAALVSQVQGGEPMKLTITSTSFAHQGEIPRKYTCHGDDVSAPLSWSNVPAGTQSLALIVDDPDAPGKTWVHWVLFNIPATATGPLKP